jgi:alkyldihydroxyacetonephosphate synthase
MKWWGWGPDSTQFTADDKPGFAPFAREHIGLDANTLNSPPPAFADVHVPQSRAPQELLRALQNELGDDAVSIGDHDRVVHARGKSIRDLILQRRGEFPRIPDVVVRPADEAAVAAAVAVALKLDAVLIAFGGGSSISGSLEPSADESRPVISLDLERLDRVLEIDRDAGLARMQAGILGPALEQQLQAQGFTLGHYPDSFSHSSLGGWIATRSSGMQSDGYGDIADMTKGLRVVTGSGTLVVRPIPSMSTGPSIRELILGSEGRLGVITEASMQVRPLPPQRLILGYLFPGFRAGLQAMQEIAQDDSVQVTVARVADPAETKFSFAMQGQHSLLAKAQSALFQQYLQRRLGWDRSEICLAFLGYEGSEDHVAAQRKAAGKIVKRHGGVCIGADAGKIYDQKKFDTPYIRDFLLDRGGAGDVSETATAWSGLQPLYENTTKAADDAFASAGVKGYVMCHLSHSYLTGACLYFTFAFTTPPGQDMLSHYDVVKTAVQQSFIDNGGTLSHHHAVGTEHAPWMPEDVSEAGIALLQGVFKGADPGRNFNPGKIVD